MSQVWIVVSNNDLGVDIHGVYTSNELADSISKQMNKENKAHVESTGFIHYGDRYYVISGNVDEKPVRIWGE
jgi:hypothetical protein